MVVNYHSEERNSVSSFWCRGDEHLPFRKYVSFSMNGTIKKKKIIVNGYDSCKTKDQRSMKLIGLNWTMKWHIERN